MSYSPCPFVLFLIWLVGILPENWGQGFCQFFSILDQICFKRGVYFQKVDSRKTSQICPNCLMVTGKKDLSERNSPSRDGRTD
ncbi:zinc ribbon domain-containing protein [Nostoc sp.]|uniref:zinc ribbon domain-containing protein n=1 Tax=Nostoc sp. TaxID=1180 RepID=UPI003FA5A196